MNSFKAPTLPAEPNNTEDDDNNNAAAGGGGGGFIPSFLDPGRQNRRRR